MGAGNLGGIPLSIAQRALMPPAEPPTTMTLFTYQDSINAAAAKWVLDPNPLKKIDKGCR
jgi:hypothetical protein